MIYGNPLIFGGSGGGGGPTAADAILTVTVPTGSTVTAVKGGVTLTPTMWVQAADASLDCALFVIPPAQFDSVNPWTVTATLETDSDTATVTISENKQYDLTITIPTWLYRRGIYNDDLSGGWVTTNRRYDSTSASGKYPTITNYADRFSFSIYNGGGTYQTVNQIDVTDFNILRLTAKGLSSSGGVLRLGTGPASGYFGTSWTSVYEIYGTEATESTHDIDISALTGNQTILIAGSYMNNTVAADFYEILLLR